MKIQRILHFFEGIARRMAFLFRRPVYVTLMGGPGAGKGTVAQSLAPQMGLAHLSTGALMRREVAQNTPLGQKIDKIMKAGKLVPDEIVFELLKAELERPSNWRGAILDGFPRTLAQAQWLSALFPSWGVRLTAAIQLDVPEADILERLSGRRVCSNTACGNTYHVKFNPPKKDGICDKCQSKLIQRADDKPEVVLARLEEYRSVQAPILDHFKAFPYVLVVLSTTNSTKPEYVVATCKSQIEARAKL